MIAGAPSLAAGLLGVFLVMPPSYADPPSRPVLCVHGFNGDASTFDAALEVLRAEGLEPIALTWEPASGDQGLAQAAELVLAPAIEAALTERGFPPDQRISFFTHSAGGLAVRHLVERHGWGERVDRVVMLSLPARGARTGLAAHACALPRSVPWRGVGCDMRQGSEFTEELGTAPPEDLAARYLSIASAWRGSPVPGGGDLDGDGLSHGNDGVVVTESGYLEGVPFAIWRGRGPSAHRRVSCNATVLAWAAEFLARGTVPAHPGHRATAADACRESAPYVSSAPPPAVPRVPLRLVVDATPATDAFVRFKLRQCRLQLLLDGELLVDDVRRKPHSDDVGFDVDIPAGEHVLALRWEATFRSATDRHHPLGSAPEPLGFSVPESGWASTTLVLDPGDSGLVQAILLRRPSVGLQGQTSVEWKVLLNVDPQEL